MVKLNVMTQAWGLRMGGAVTWQSGPPYSFLQTGDIGFKSPPPYPNERVDTLRFRLRHPTGQRNDQRSPAYWNFDLRLSKPLQLQDARAEVSVEVFNLFNDDALLADNVTEGQISGTRRFGRRWQLGFRLSF